MILTKNSSKSKTINNNFNKKRGETMMNSTYLYQTQDTAPHEHEHMHAYAKQKGFKSLQAVEEHAPIHVHWQERALGKTLENAQAGDVVVAYDSTQFAHSANQALEILLSLVDRGVTLHFTKYNMSYNGDNQYKLAELLTLLRKIESDYVSRRNVEAIERRRNMGVVLGRPKGRKNKALKLDKFKKEITRYLELSISKASIAKLVNCHPQTLYDWIERNSIPDRKPRKPRVRKLETA
jgi:putative DNA-invertase from lambdoid prophage Rac